jgi:hypothetical protein
MDEELLTKLFFGAISGILFFWLGPKIIRVFNGKPKDNQDKDNSTEKKYE